MKNMRMTVVSMAACVTVVLSASSVLKAEDTSVDEIASRSSAFGDYTKPNYDKDKACKIVLDYLTKHPDLASVDRCYLLVFLGNLNSMWALGGSRDLGKAREYYAQAIDVMEGMVNLDVLVARVNLVSLITERNRRIRETAALCAWLAMHRLMDDETFEAHVSFRNRQTLTDRRYKTQLKRLRRTIGGQIKVNSKNLISMIESEPDSRQRLKILAEVFPAGALAYEKLSALPEPTTQQVKKAATSQSAEEQEILKVITEVSRIQRMWRSLSGKEIGKAFERLTDQRVIAGVENNRRICDKAYVATSYIISGSSDGYHFNKASVGERDKLIKDRLEQFYFFREHQMARIPVFPCFSCL